MLLSRCENRLEISPLIASFLSENSFLALVAHSSQRSGAAWREKKKKKRSLFHRDDSLSRLYRVPGFLYERSNKRVELTCVQFSFEQMDWISDFFSPFFLFSIPFFLFVICRLTGIDTNALVSNRNGYTFKMDSQHGISNKKDCSISKI